MNCRLECNELVQKNKKVYLADRGRPPRADIIGPDKAASATLVPSISEKALPHKTSDEIPTSPTINPLVP